MRSLRKRRSSKSSKKKLTKEKTECGTIAKSPKKASEKDSAKEGEEKKDTGKAKTVEPTEEMKAAKHQVEEKGSQPPAKAEKPPEAEKEKPAAEPPAPQKPAAVENKEPPKEEKKVQTSVRLKPSQSAPNLGSEKAAGQAVTQKSVMAQPQGTPAAKPQSQQATGGEEAPKEDQPRNEEKATPKEEKSQRMRRKRQQQQQTTKEEKSVRATSIRERVKRGLKSAFSVFSRESIEKSFQTAKNKMTATIRTATYAYQDTYFGLGSDLDDDMEEDEDEVFLRDMSHRPDLTLVEGNNNNDGELFNDKGVPFWKDKKYLAEVPKQTRKPLSTLLLSLAEKKLTLKESVPEP
ncbi:hypothetical protein OESDEN_10629 [Oesophagostomum dentatum]|uniref:Uncharacterized protein n=1 Tax=Oesophagostomum dentatum TaxID=61180 RepID=A0A0B1T2D1_OESDE|nr:hypothetical protein OESDEN_10629 [Oesophagostomum dentatum]